MPEEMEDLMEDGAALLVLEWPEFLARQYYAEERLEVRLLHASAPLENLPEKSEEIPALTSKEIGFCGLLLSILYVKFNRSKPFFGALNLFK